MSDLDVLIIGGYSLSEVWSGGGQKTRDKMRLQYNNHLVTLNFIKHFVRSEGNLQKAENLFIKDNKSRLVSRSLNAVYLIDYLTKNKIKAEAVNYFYHEQDKFNNLMAQKPKVVAISTSFIYSTHEINAIAKAAKKLYPDTCVVAGGIKILKSHRKYSLYNEGYFNGYDTESMISNNYFFNKETDEPIDVFIIEEHGEVTLSKLINKIISDEDFKSLPNLAFYNKKKLIFTKKEREPHTFESNLISWDKISKEIVGQEIPVMAGLGCPFKCAFCDFTGLHKVKLRTMDSLIEELQLIQKSHEGNAIFFTDDNLFSTKKRAKDLAQAIIGNNLKFRWKAFFRTDAISDDNVDLLAKAGCATAFLGVESGDNQILSNMDKKATCEQNLNAIHLLSKAGISTVSTMIIGFPGETKDSVNNTIDLLNNYPDVKLPIHQYYPFTFLLFPLSPIASPENREKYSIKGGIENWSHSTMSSYQAKEELLRVFKEVNVPVLPYIEYIDPDIPYTILREVVKTRENIVKGGTNYLGSDNKETIYNKFKTIIP